MTPQNHGSVEVICGSMFSGKTDELIRRLRRATQHPPREPCAGRNRSRIGLHPAFEPPWMNRPAGPRDHHAADEEVDPTCVSLHQHDRAPDNADRTGDHVRQAEPPPHDHECDEEDSPHAITSNTLARTARR